MNIINEIKNDDNKTSILNIDSEELKHFRDF
jgi:hypothetical protein